jgi:hypothetical protein
MSDFLVNLVRRGAGLAPIVRSRSAPDTELAEDARAAVESDPQPAAAAAAPTPITPATQSAPSKAAPGIEVAQAPIARSTAIAPSGVIQRAPVAALGDAVTAPVTSPVGAITPLPAERQTVVRAFDPAPPPERSASAPPIAPAPLIVRATQVVREPGERTVEIRREEVSLPVPASPVPVRPSELQTTAVVPTAPSTLTGASADQGPAVRTRREPDMAEVTRARPASASVVLVGRGLPSEPPQETPHIARAPVPSGVGQVARTDQRNALSHVDPVTIFVPVPAAVERESEERPAPNPKPAPLVELRSENIHTVERMVELPAAVQTVRPRQGIEVGRAAAPVLGSARLDASIPERIVNVRIGAVEIHAAAVPAVLPASAPSVPAAQPSAGFDEFASLRRYGPWQP